ncbi:MAG: ABC transporter permease subunit [Planctomycetes bacterium]|nr:ABC transporter permease subunit [Planctomycetota bacterium]
MTEASISRRWRRRTDLLARWVVRAGGMAIIASVLGIFVFILIEVAPLFRRARAASAPEVPVPPTFLLAGVDETEELAFGISAPGRVEFIPLTEREAPAATELPGFSGRTPTCVFRPLREEEIDVGTADGRLVTASVRFRVGFGEATEDWRSSRTITPETSEPTVLQLDPQEKPLQAVARQSDSRGLVAAAITEDKRLVYLCVLEKKTLMGGVKRTEHRADLTGELPAAPTALTIDGSLENIYVGTAAGHVVHFDIRDLDAPRKVGFDTVRAAGSTPVTAMALLIGDQSLVVGEESGALSVWFQVDDAASSTGKALRRIREFPSHPAAVTAIAPSARDKGFATGDRAGRVRVHHSTSGRTLLSLEGDGSAVTQLVMTPRATGLLALHESGRISRWRIDNPHPEITLQTLFGKVWYEGYNEPAYSWQSGGGTDDFEPKFSLTPLIFGTLKGTVYALLIAVPIAILAAIYTAQFMHPDLRNLIKPTIEVMAALPSVVLGFLAGLWLAPAMERYMPAVLLMLIGIPASTLLALGAWLLLPSRLRGRSRGRLEIVLLMPVLVLAGAACFALGGPLERALFGGDFQQWWYETTGLTYDQRNAVVVGIAMGFAVIPIIFTISEDALSNVPRHLVSGSLALGATRWQTAVRVVLPTASPGIFSAIMIGFGRVVGETMIVLMATGNTPIMEWNLFNGFRTLSANIAVEIPEAPHGGTLYRILFLGALLLFAATFLVNTAAEMVRMRMRARYARL